MFLYRVKRVSYGTLLGLALPLWALAANAAAPADDDLPREINKAMTAIESYSAGQKDQAVADGEALLRAIDRRVAALESGADEAGEAARRAWLESRARLERLRETAGLELQDLRGASARAWVDAKHRFHSAVDELGEAFEDAAAQLGVS